MFCLYLPDLTDSARTCRIPYHENFSNRSELTIDEEQHDSFLHVVIGIGHQGVQLERQLLVFMFHF